MGVMKVPGDEVVDVIAVRHGFVAAPRTVLMVLRVRGAIVLGRAFRRIR
jgi:hypothetical protein